MFLRSVSHSSCSPFLNHSLPHPHRLTKDPHLANTRIADTTTEETPNPNHNPNPNPNPNDLIKVASHEHNDLINIMSSLMMFGKDPHLAPIRITDTTTEETPNLNPNPNPNDLINVMSHKHNDLINIMSSLMMFGKDPHLAPIRITDTTTEETPNPNPNPNDLINVMSHKHINLINIMSSLMMFGKDPHLATIMIPDTTTEETPNPNTYRPYGLTTTLILRLNQPGL